jgi:competence protein ComGF
VLLPYNGLKKSEAFSLIEVIIALSVLLLLTSLIPLLFTPLQKNPSPSQFEDTSLFFAMLGKEIREASSLTIENNSLFLTRSNDDVVSFSKYRTLIRKQLNGLGHEVWLQNIAGMVVEMRDDGLIEVTLTDTDGHHYQHAFWRME